MRTDLKSSILELRLEGLTYKEIQEKLGCSKGVISYHCANVDGHWDIVGKNLRAKKRHDPEKTWDQTTKTRVSQMYDYGIQMTEIADVLGLLTPEVQSFCRGIPKKSYSSLPNCQKVKRRRRKIKILGVIYKGGRCEICGYDKCFEALEFHHLDPTKKEFTIASKCNHAWKTIKRELDKCQLVCSCCHREIHIVRDGSDMSPRSLLL